MNMDKKSYKNYEHTINKAISLAIKKTEQKYSKHYLEIYVDLSTGKVESTDMLLSTTNLSAISNTCTLFLIEAISKKYKGLLFMHGWTYLEDKPQKEDIRSEIEENLEEQEQQEIDEERYRRNEREYYEKIDSYKFGNIKNPFKTPQNILRGLEKDTLNLKRYLDGQNIIQYSSYFSNDEEIRKNFIINKLLKNNIFYKIIEENPINLSRICERREPHLPHKIIDKDYSNPQYIIEEKWCTGTHNTTIFPFYLYITIKGYVDFIYVNIKDLEKVHKLFKIKNNMVITQRAIKW